MENEYLEKVYREIDQADKLDLLKRLMTDLGLCSRCVESMPCLSCGNGL